MRQKFYSNHTQYGLLQQGMERFRCTFTKALWLSVCPKESLDNFDFELILNHIYEFLLIFN